MSQHGTHNPNAGPGYETTDVHIAPITKFMIGLVLLMFIGMILGWMSFRALDFKQSMDYADLKSTKIQETRRVPTGPLLQVSNHDDLIDFRAEQARDVTGHATWVKDSAKTAVRLPIARAIELVSERGLPVFKSESAQIAAKEVAAKK
jgi:hypothetical protein